MLTRQTALPKPRHWLTSSKEAIIKPVTKDPSFLAQKSIRATLADLSVAQDMRDTLEANRETCVGMAANMISVSKRIILFDDSGSATVMFNPGIIKCYGSYEAEEGCLTLAGIRKTKRWRSSKARYQNERMET